MELLLNLGIVGLALYLTVSRLRFLCAARRVRGELVAYNSERDSEGDWLHNPVYRFSDERGRTITTSNPRNVWVVRRLEIGQACDLRYNPANPAQLWRDSWLDLWLLPAALWGVSALILVRLVVG
jgi:hypothetical protein